MDQSPIGDSRLYPQVPVVAAAAIIFREGKILMVKRAKEPNKGKWSIPGGRIELGESIYEAVKREVSEECNIEIEVLRVFDAADNVIRDEEKRVRYHYVTIDILARYKDGQIKAQSDVDDYRWVMPKELLEIDITPQLRAVLLRVTPDLF